MRFLVFTFALWACRNNDPQPNRPPRDAALPTARDAVDYSDDFAALDEIFGGGQLIRGFDPAKVLVSTPTSLKKAVPPSFVIGLECDDDACDADAPPVPSGKTKLRIGVVRAWNSVAVMFDIAEPQRNHVLGILEGSLGVSKIIDKRTRVYTHGGLRYVVRLDRGPNAFTVKITKDCGNDCNDL